MAGSLGVCFRFKTWVGFLPGSCPSDSNRHLGLLSYMQFISSWRSAASPYWAGRPCLVGDKRAPLVCSVVALFVAESGVCCAGARPGRMEYSMAPGGGPPRTVWAEDFMNPPRSQENRLSGSHSKKWRFTQSYLACWPHAVVADVICNFVFPMDHKITLGGPGAAEQQAALGDWSGRGGLRSCHLV